MVATTAGVALTLTSVVQLFGRTELPITARLILDAACLYVMWSVISNANNIFGVYRPLGYVAFGSGVLAFLAVARDLVMTALHPPGTPPVRSDPATLAMILGAFLAGALLLRAGNAWFARARRYLVQLVRDPADLRGLRYGLYLRTFGQDEELAEAPSFTRPKTALRSLFVIEPPEELLVADALSADDTPLIAVGQPGEAAPHVGALRVHLPSTDWQPQVRDLIAGARHVVLVLGWGAGTRWELDEARRILRPEQLILVVPMDQPEYDRFRVATGSWLPAYAGRREIRAVVRGLVTFADDWAATFVPVRRYSPFHNSLRIALLFAAWPALRRLGYPPRGVLRWAPTAGQ